MVKLLINNAFPTFESGLKEALAEKSAYSIINRGEMILRMHSPINNCHVVLQGSVKVYRENAEGAEFILAYLKEGDSFAVSISDDTHDENKISLVSFAAIERTHLLKISFAEKDILAKQFDQWYKYILATSVMYYRFYLDIIDSIAFKKLDYRIEFFLKGLSHNTGKKILYISHSDIANGLHCSREAVSRLLKKMEKMGMLILRHNEIEIVGF